MFRAVAANMCGIDWRKENVYQRQLENTLCPGGRVPCVSEEALDKEMKGNEKE